MARQSQMHLSAHDALKPLHEQFSNDGSQTLKNYKTVKSLWPQNYFSSTTKMWFSLSSVLTSAVPMVHKDCR